MKFPREDSEQFAKQYGFWMIYGVVLVVIALHLIEQVKPLGHFLAGKPFEVTARLASNQLQLGFPNAESGSSVSAQEISFIASDLSTWAKVQGTLVVAALAALLVFTAVVGYRLCREIDRCGVFTDRVWRLTTALFFGFVVWFLVQLIWGRAIDQDAVTRVFGEGYDVIGLDVPSYLPLPAIFGFMAFRAILVSGRKMRESLAASAASA